MLTLALDVDGVLLDPDRNGKGDWTNVLTTRFGIGRDQIDAAFFSRMWADIIVGRQSVEDGLAEALDDIGSTADVESVLASWFTADFVPFDETLDLARRAARAGHRVVLATNQEHRRAEYLRQHIGAVVPIDQVLYSADLGHQKHDRRFFELASERLGVIAARRSDLIFVDDALHNVEMARSFGWRGVHAEGDGAWREEVATLLGLDDIATA